MSAYRKRGIIHLQEEILSKISVEARIALEAGSKEDIYIDEYWDKCDEVYNIPKDLGLTYTKANF